MYINMTLTETGVGVGVGWGEKQKPLAKVKINVILSHLPKSEKVLILGKGRYHKQKNSF